MKKQITNGRIFAVCLGEFARAVIGGLIVTYSLKFFNVTPSSGLPLLLPTGLLGLLRGVGVIFDAITDPWVASLSDKSKNPKGRRIPFIRMAAIPYALCCLLVFFPPAGQVSWVNVVWVIAMLLLYYLFSTLYTVPYLALSPELVTDTRRRVFYYTVSSLMFVLGSAVIYVLPVLVSVFGGMGMAPVWAWRVALAIFAAVGAVCALVPGLAIREEDYVERKSYYKPLMESLRATFRYRNFRILTAGYLVMQVGFVFFNTALLFYIDVLLGLSENFATLVLGISIVVGICTYPLVGGITRRYGKKPLLLFSCFMYVVIYTGIYFYKPISTFLGTEPVTAGWVVAFAGQGALSGNVICALLIGLLVAFPIACTNILPPAAFADLAQYDTITTGDNKTGMFVAARTFVTKLAQAFVTAVVSYVMYVGSADGYPSVMGVRLTALIAAFCLLFAIFFYGLYDDRQVVSEIDGWNEQQKREA